MTQELTEKCVDDLLKKFSSYSIKIIIVDNASNNNSGKKLKEKYANNDIVKIILNNKNEGFARGNNIGFEYLKNNFDIDFMIIMNNDVFIKSDNFLELTRQIYAKYKYAVLGPDIYAPKLNAHQNPQEYELPTIESYKYWIKRYKKILWKIRFKYLLEKISPISNKKTTTDNVKNVNPKFENKIIKNCILHGACFIFSKDFIKKREYAFYPNTFLYFEEHILSLQCINENLPIIYSPEIKVEHLCHVSTEYTYGNGYKKDCMFLTNSIKGMKEYIKLCKYYGK